MARSGITSVHTVVIGASAGGIEALRGLIAQLPADFPAAVCVVLHISARGPSVLPQILTRAGELPAVQAENGMPLEGGRIHVAPPAHHLLVNGGVLRLDGGARINGHRPAIDALFRSAATHGAGAAGVVLSGVLDDGTAGLMAIKRAGGVTLVQDPDEALYEMMPRSAIEVVTPDRVDTAAALGEYLAAIAAPPPLDAPGLGPGGQEQLVDVDRGSTDQPQPGEVTGFTCPECNGAIWLSEEDDGIVRLACRTGHGWSLDTFAASQTDRVETALWTALRTLEERAALYRRIATRHRGHGNTRTAERFALRAESAVQHAFVLRDLIENFDGEREGVA